MGFEVGVLVKQPAYSGRVVGMKRFSCLFEDLGGQFRSHADYSIPTIPKILPSGSTASQEPHGRSIIVPPNAFSLLASASKVSLTGHCSRGFGGEDISIWSAISRGMAWSANLVPSATNSTKLPVRVSSIAFNPRISP